MFGESHILDANDPFIEFEIDNFVDKEERIPVRQYSLNSIRIENDTFFLFVLKLYNLLFKLTRPHILTFYLLNWIYEFNNY